MDERGLEASASWCTPQFRCLETGRAGVESGEWGGRWPATDQPMSLLLPKKPPSENRRSRGASKEALALGSWELVQSLPAE